MKPIIMTCLLFVCALNCFAKNPPVTGHITKNAPQINELKQKMSQSADLISQLSGGKIKFTNDEYNDIYLLGTSYSAETRVSNISECRVDQEKFVISFKKPFVAESPVSLFPLIYAPMLLSEFYIFNDSDVQMTKSDKVALKQSLTTLKEYVNQYEKLVYNY